MEELTQRERSILKYSWAGGDRSLAPVQTDRRRQAMPFHEAGEKGALSSYTLPQGGSCPVQ